MKTCAGRTLGIAFSLTTMLAGFAIEPVRSHSPQIPTVYKHLFGGGGGMYLESMYLPPVTTGPWSPDWSPDGRQIVFSMQGSLWTIPAKGGEAIQITSGPHYDSEPDWSPDGRQLAFTRDTGHTIDIWVVGTDGSNPRQITRSPAFSVNPRWSPDGKEILFVTTRNDKRTLDLVSIVPSDGSGRAILVDDHQNITPSWSPDGKEIVFVSNRGWNDMRIQGTGGIWKVSAGSAEPRLLLQEESVWHARPAWSPDGLKVAYVSFRGGHNQLWVMSSKSANPLRLTYVDGEVFTPAWSPDSRNLAYISNGGGKFTLWTVPAMGGPSSEVRVSARKHRDPVGKLQVVVRDKSTGAETEARVYLKAADGKGYTPLDEFHRMVVLTGDHYFHTRGRFVVDLPVGAATVEVMKGFEFRPEKREVRISPGQTSTLEIALERLTDMSAQGWYSGDNHIHMNYGGIFEGSPRSLLLEADGEDLHVINDLIANQSGTRIHDLKYFEGKLSSQSKANRLLYFNEEYRPSFAGHLSLLNLKEFFFPQFDGMEGTSLAAHYPSNSHVLDAVHAQGGYGGYVHPYSSGAPEESNYGGAREFPVNAALGNVDYFDLMCIWSDEYLGEKVWYRVLNLGLRVPASAGTDAMTNYWRAPAIGTVRVYVKTNRPIDYERWMRDMTRGRSFVTSGPLLFLKVDGREPGDEIRLAADGTPSVKVAAEAKSIFPMQTLDIVQNGKVVKTVKPTDPYNVKLDATLPVERTGWIAARVTGPQGVHGVMDTYVYAHTNPVYVLKGQEPARSTEDARYFVTWIDSVLRMLQGLDRFDTPEQKQEILQVWRKARDVYARMAEP